MISLAHYSIFSNVLFTIGLAGLMRSRSSIIRSLMCIELLFLAINTQLIAFGYYTASMTPQILVLLVLAISACETAVALAILVKLFHTKGNVHIDTFHQLRH